MKSKRGDTFSAEHEMKLACSQAKSLNTLPTSCAARLVKFCKMNREEITILARTNSAKFLGKILSQHRFVIPTFVILLIGILSSLALIEVHQNLSMPNAVAVVEPPAFKQPETLNGLLALSPAELEHCDIARMNLLCAEALPGAEILNVEE